MVPYGIHSMELKVINPHHKTVIWSPRNPFNGIESYISHSICTLYCTESIQWNWKGSPGSSLTHTPAMTGIHSMELKEAIEAALEYARQQNLRIHSMELKVSSPSTSCISCSLGIHSMELKDFTLCYNKVPYRREESIQWNWKAGDTSLNYPRWFRVRNPFNGIERTR